MDLPATGSIYAREGHCANNPEQLVRLHDLVRAKAPARILEIGFNAGHSAELFLRASDPACTVTSVDIGYHDYVNDGKRAIDGMYPGRHRLILEDSTRAIPRLAAETAASERYDVIFIDGCHTYEVAAADLKNCRALAADGALVILDDTYWSGAPASFNVGPNRVWQEAIAAGWVVRQAEEDYAPSRGMSWGRYA